MACIAVTTGGPYCKYLLSLAEGSVFLISAYLVSTFYSVETTIGTDFFSYTTFLLTETASSVAAFFS